MPYVSRSAFTAILSEIEKKGLPEITSKRGLQEIDEHNLNALDSYGPLFTTASAVETAGGEQPVLLVNFLSYLQGCFQTNGSFTELLLEAHARRPSSPEDPWRLIVYSDEVVPGNVIAHRQERKTWAVYVAFQELGQLVLQSESAWLVQCLMRTSMVNKLDAGISQLIALVLKNIFCGDYDVQRAGIVLQCGGKRLRLFFRLGMLLQDGAAHKMVLGLKGDGASKYCLLCKNEFRIASAADDGEDSEEDVCFTVLKHNHMALCTDAEILGSVERLSARKATCSAADFKLWERATGFNHQPSGLLLDAKLKAAGVVAPASQFCHDWMHGIASNGTLVVAIYLLCASLQQNGMDAWKLLHSFLAMWVLPASTNMSHLAELFSASKVDNYIKKKEVYLYGF